ncbi:glycosyltransferase [Blastococcus sp. SYSU D00695]
MRYVRATPADRGAARSWSPGADGRPWEEQHAMGRRTSVITWQRHAGRAEEMAAALDGRVVHIHPGGLRGSVPRTLARYALSAVLTLAHLLRVRPHAVVVTNPPIVPGLIVTAYAWLARRVFVLDSHPTSFGAKDHAVSQRLLPLHRAMARRAAAVMVTTDSWADVVDEWGGHGLVVHEAPPTLAVPPREPHERRPQVLYVGVFGDDEPVEVVFDAARLLPDVDVAVTGDAARCPAHLLADRSSNVHLTGFLGPEAYRDAMAAADVVVVLTTEPTSVVRAGYEAVYARRALVLTDTAALRQYFPQAVFTENEGASLAAAVRSAVAMAGDRARADAAHATQTARWEQQRAALRSALEAPLG